MIYIGGFFFNYNVDPNVPNHFARILPQDGSVDTTFNYGSNTAGFDNAVRAMAIDGDGRIVVGGDFFSHNGDPKVPNHLARILPDGSVDTTFNYGSNTAGFDGDVYSVAIDAQQRILVGGFFTSYNGDLNVPNCLARLHSDGSIDTTFNYGTETAGLNNVVYSVALDADQKIVVGGAFTSYNGDENVPDFLARLLPDGSVDTTFNYGTNTAGFNDVVLSVAIDAQQRILVGGFFTSYNGDLNVPNCLARVFPDGSIDMTFNYGSSILGFNGAVNSVAIDRQERILVGGDFTSYNLDSDAPDNLARILSDGSRDMTFNSGTNSGFDGVVRSVAIDNQGRILVGGDFTRYNGDVDVPNNLARVLSDGSIDTTFNYGKPSEVDDGLVYAVVIDLGSPTLPTPTPSPTPVPVPTPTPLFLAISSQDARALANFILRIVLGIVVLLASAVGIFGLYYGFTYFLR